MGLITLSNFLKRQAIIRNMNGVNLKKSILIYPNPTIDNQYIRNLASCFNNEDFLIKNSNNDHKLNYLEAYKKFFRCKIFYFNWIENVPAKRKSFVHFLFIFVILNLLKYTSKRIVWTFHNITSHSGESWMVTKLINWLLYNSDLVVTHSKQSLSLLEEKGRKKASVYFFHPISNKDQYKPVEEPFKEYDVLIWGMMHRYKGVLEFLQYLEAEKKLERWRIKIIGGFADLDYQQKVTSYNSSYINIESEYASFEKIALLHSKSRFILFPYIGKSVLNSGVLADSLGFNSPIIGPNVGAFKDLAKENIILTYQTYADIDFILEHNLLPNFELKNEFVESCRWSLFEKVIRNELTLLT